MSEVKTITELFEYLPHRYILFACRSRLETVVGERIKGYKNITANEELFNGHFPGQPIFPGVLILKHMAQLSGVLAFETKGFRPADGTNYLFGGVEKARFRDKSYPAID